MKHDLNDIEKKNIFRAPENYFEEFPKKMQGIIQMEQVSPRMQLRWKPVVSLASIVLIALVIYLIPGKSSDTESFISDFSESEVVEYLANTGYDAETLIISTVSEEDIDALLIKNNPEEEYLFNEMYYDDILLEENIEILDSI